MNVKSFIQNRALLFCFASSIAGFVGGNNGIRVLLAYLCLLLDFHVNRKYVINCLFPPLLFILEATSSNSDTIFLLLVCLPST